jgi:hypothetical protein
MKRGLYRIMRGNNEVAEGNPMRIHLLVSVQPDNEAALASGENDRNYDILVFNPKKRKSHALIKQIALIRHRGTSEDKEGVCETKGKPNKTGSASVISSQNNTENRRTI